GRPPRPPAVGDVAEGLVAGGGFEPPIPLCGSMSERSGADSDRFSRRSLSHASVFSVRSLADGRLCSPAEVRDKRSSTGGSACSSAFLRNCCAVPAGDLDRLRHRCKSVFPCRSRAYKRSTACLKLATSTTKAAPGAALQNFGCGGWI